MKTSNLQIRMTPELYETVLAAGGAEWARDTLTAVLAADIGPDRLADMVELTRRLGSLGVEDPMGFAATVAEDATSASMEAAQALTAAGWSGGEILAVMQCMMGTHWMYGYPLGGALRAEMYDAARLDAVDLAQWGVSADRWAERSARVGASPEEARALLDVARVFWAPGSKLERILRREFARETQGEP